MRAIGKNVILRKFHEKSTSPSGLLYLPNAKDHAVLQGRIISVGDEVENITEGDVVLYEQYTGVAITDENGKDLLMLPAHDIVARVEREDDK